MGEKRGLLVVWSSSGPGHQLRTFTKALLNLSNFVKCSHQSLTAILGGNEGTARISLAGILSGVGGAHHVGGDAAICIVAIGVGCHCDVDLLQGIGMAASAAEGAPPGDGGYNSGVCGA